MSYSLAINDHFLLKVSATLSRCIQERRRGRHEAKLQRNMDEMDPSNEISKNMLLNGPTVHFVYQTHRHLHFNRLPLLRVFYSQLMFQVMGYPQRLATTRLHPTITQDI
ncbi:conserved hypothetical protein [Trichinella spiralis]|uniref:hypothetical protein n=1 Tax=Trichinella spiralis TaxID=6334 RepID=UPI0001EFD9B0|nr:conserved hypothetical protein [Trichinella spiralis]